LGDQPLYHPACGGRIKTVDWEIVFILPPQAILFILLLIV
jgi:hypothetical protein